MTGLPPDVTAMADQVIAECRQILAMTVENVPEDLDLVKVACQADVLAQDVPPMKVAIALLVAAHRLKHGEPGSVPPSVNQTPSVVVEQVTPRRYMLTVKDGAFAVTDRQWVWAPLPSMARRRAERKARRILDRFPMGEHREIWEVRP